MTFKELEELRVKAGKVSGSEVSFKIEYDGSVSVGRYGLPESKELHDVPLAEAIDFMRKLATKPEPINVTISVPYQWAVKVASRSNTETANGFEIVQANCRTAITPYQLPEVTAN